jgi:hypothetical protein
MATSTKAPTKTAPTFPADAVKDCLRDELVAAVQAEAQRKGSPLTGNAIKLGGMAIEIDSLTVVETLCALDDVLPFQVDESVVRAGGYDSIDEALTHVIGGIETKWKEHHEKG